MMTSFQSSISTGPAVSPGPFRTLQTSIQSQRSAQERQAGDIPAIVGGSDVDQFRLFNPAFRGMVMVTAASGSGYYGTLASVLPHQFATNENRVFNPGQVVQLDSGAQAYGSGSLGQSYIRAGNYPNGFYDDPSTGGQIVKRGRLYYRGTPFDPANPYYQYRNLVEEKPQGYITQAGERYAIDTGITGDEYAWGERYRTLRADSGQVLHQAPPAVPNTFNWSGTYTENDY